MWFTTEWLRFIFFAFSWTKCPRKFILVIRILVQRGKKISVVFASREKDDFYVIFVGYIVNIWLYWIDQGIIKIIHVFWSGHFRSFCSWGRCPSSQVPTISYSPISNLKTQGSKAQKANWICAGARMNFLHPWRKNCKYRDKYFSIDFGK